MDVYLGDFASKAWASVTSMQGSRAAPLLALLQGKRRAPPCDLLYGPSQKCAADGRVILPGRFSPERQVSSFYSHRHWGHGMDNRQALVLHGRQKRHEKVGRENGR